MIISPKKFGDDGAPPINSLRLAFGRFLFTADLLDKISMNCQNLFVHLGEFAAGDEKLFHFTGNSADIMMVPSKPDKIGFWFYELAISLSCGLAFMVDLRMKYCKRGIEHVDTIVMRWVEAMAQFSEVRPKGCPMMLAFDMYYLSGGTREYLAREETRKDVVVTASCKSSMFRAAEDKLKQAMARETKIVTQPGDWWGIYNPETQESLFRVYDTDKGVGEKLNYSTMIREVPRRNAVDTENRYIRGGYDYYKQMFDVCDKFNRNLHDKTWPFKCGGRNARGDEHHQHNFAISCVLQNTFALFIDINDIMRADRKDFKGYCLELADEIYALSLDNLTRE